MKPQDFFITARDFFSIVVPGALLVMLIGAADPHLNLWVRVRDALGKDSATINLLICFVCTYAIGTVLSGIGSTVDFIADRATKKLMDRAARQDSVRFFFRKADKLRQTELLARDLELLLAPGMRRLHVDSRPWSTRAFWWNYLRLNCPAGTMELDRVEGQQKQYRSMAVGGAILTVYYLVYGTGGYVLAALAATLLLTFTYWSFRNRFARRLFELAIVHAVPETRFQASGGEFLNAEDVWSALTRRQARRGNGGTTSD